jgi:hypothetical protein
MRVGGGWHVPTQGGNFRRGGRDDRGLYERRGAAARPVFLWNHGWLRRRGAETSSRELRRRLGAAS